MMDIVLIVLILLLLLTFVMFFFLSKIVQDINKKSKEYYALKLQEYDDLVEEKERKLSEVQKLQLQDKEIFENVQEKQNKKEDFVLSLDVPLYQMEDFFEKAKMIENKFQFDEEEIIVKFMAEKVKNDYELYAELLLLKKELLDNGFYQLFTSRDTSFIPNILQRKSLKLQSCIRSYEEDFSLIQIEDLLVYVDLEVQKNNPLILIEVGKKNVNYNYLNQNIKTIYNPKIYRGIRIFYKNKLYNYSLS